MEGLERLTEAVRMLAEARSLKEIKDVISIAKAAEAYAKAEKLGKEAEDYAAEIRIRAAKKAGEALRKSPRHKGGRPATKPVDDIDKLIEEEIKLPEVDITRDQSSDWQEIAKADEEDFEETLAKAKDEGKTSDRFVADMLRSIRKTREQPSIAEDLTPEEAPQEASDSLTGVVGHPGTVIYAIPSYSTMTLEEIAALPIPKLASNNTMLFIWSPATLLVDVIRTANKWGFTYKNHMVWDRGTSKADAYINVQHELLLVFQKGTVKSPKDDNKPDSIFKSSRYEEGEDKPFEVYDIITSMYPDCIKVGLYIDDYVTGWERGEV